MSVGILEIDRLRLDELFPSNGKHAFNQAWTLRTDSLLLVIDDAQQNRTVFSENIEQDRDFGLLVINNKNNVVVLLAIDHALVDNHVGGITDCALLHQSQVVFVEFKTNALGGSEPSTMSTFDKAVSQLKETIHFFENKLSTLSLDLKSSSDVSCRIILAHSFPKATAAKQDIELAFLEEEGLDLSFESQLTFS